MTAAALAGARRAGHTVPMSRTVVAAVVIVTLLAPEAHTSQVFHRSVTLADLKRGTAVVVVAEPALPHERVVPIDITPKGQKPNATKWPPYNRVLRRFVVKEVVSKNAALLVDETAKPVALPAVGSVVEVMSADAHHDQWLHTAWYVEGMSESPIYDRYIVTGTSASKTRLLFLRHDGDGWSFVVDGAEELVEHRAAVEAAFAAP